MARLRLGEILVRAGVLTKEGLEEALQEQKRRGGPLGRCLVQLGQITEETLVRALSAQLELPAVALAPRGIDPRVARIVPRQLCERYQLICFRTDPDGRFIHVAMSDPANLEAIDEVRVATGRNVRPHIAGPRAVGEAISVIFHGAELMIGNELELDEDRRGAEAAASGFMGTEQPASPQGYPSAGSEPAARQGPVSIRAEVGSSPSTGEGLPAERSQAPLPGHGPVSIGSIGSVASGGPVSIGAMGGASGGAAAGGAAVPAPGSASAVVPLAPEAGEGLGQRVAFTLPPPRRESGFHVTLDLPAIDKPAAAVRRLEERVGELESIVARNGQVLEALLGALVSKGWFGKEELTRIIGGSS